ncbi:hypothetical protein GQX74_010892 [Glossina fuscipes]|nr:hypothetical protein GQX74_010892 [Glossina fuscipes]
MISTRFDQFQKGCNFASTFQGLQGRDCQYNANKKCMDNVPQDCSGEQQLIVSDFIESSRHGLPKHRNNLFSEEFDMKDFDENTTSGLRFNSNKSACKRALNQLQESDNLYKN